MVIFPFPLTLTVENVSETIAKISVLASTVEGMDCCCRKTWGALVGLPGTISLYMCGTWRFGRSGGQ